MPVFPAEQAGSRGNRGLEPLTQRGQGARSWYQRWVEKVLTPFDPLAATRYSADVLEAVIHALESTGLVRRLDAGRTHAFALEPERFYATARVAVMCGRHAKLVVPEQEANLWRGVPCLDLGLQDEYRAAASEPPTWFGRLYRETTIRRIVAAEHTALIGGTACCASGTEKVAANAGWCGPGFREVASLAVRRNLAMNRVMPVANALFLPPLAIPEE